MDEYVSRINYKKVIRTRRRVTKQNKEPTIDYSIALRLDREIIIDI